MAKLNNLTGQRFGRLVVIGRAYPNYNRETLHPYCKPIRVSYTRWKVRCDCGNEKEVLGINLTHGRTKSCGCLVKDKLRERRENDRRRVSV